MKGLIKIVVGLIIFVAIVYVLTYQNWLWATLKFLQGGVIVLLFLIGLGFVILGFSDLKE